MKRRGAPSSGTTRRSPGRLSGRALLGLVVLAVAVVVTAQVVAGIRSPDKTTGEHPRFCRMLRGLADIEPMAELATADLRHADPASKERQAALVTMLSNDDAPPRIRDDVARFTGDIEARLAGSTAMPQVEATALGARLDRYARTCTPERSAG